MWGEIEQEVRLIANEWRAEMQSSLSCSLVRQFQLTRGLLVRPMIKINLTAHTTFSDLKSSLSKLIEELYDFVLHLIGGLYYTRESLLIGSSHTHKTAHCLIYTSKNNRYCIASKPIACFLRGRSEGRQQMVKGFSTIICSFRYHRFIIQTRVESTCRLPFCVCVHPVQRKWRQME